MGNGTSELDRFGCEYGRMLRKDVDSMKEDVADIIDRLQNRPSWPVATMITIMSSLIVGMAVVLLK